MRNSPGWLFITILAGLTTLGPFSFDGYLPALPSIAVETGAGAIGAQQTLSVYLLAFAVMMLWHGSISDATGRRPVILISLLVFTVASIGCALSSSIEQLLFFRMLQGGSAGVGIVLSRAIIRDCYHDHRAQRLMSHLNLAFGVAPVIAPIIGGWLQHSFGWRSIFLFLSLLGIALTVLCATQMKETLPPQQRQPFEFRPLMAGYLQVLLRGEFQLLSGCLAFNFAGLFLYIASAPAFLMDHLKLSSQEFAWLFMPAVAGMVVGSLIAGRLAGRLAVGPTIHIAYAVMVIGAVLNVAYHAIAAPALPWSVLPLMVYTCGMAIAMPAMTLLVIDLFPAKRGMVSSLQGFTQSMVGSLTAGLVSPWLSGSTINLAFGMAAFLVLGLVSWAVYLTVTSKRNYSSA